MATQPRTILAVVALMSVVGVGQAAASPLFEVVGGENGGGSNARFSSPGVSSAYFNPALLTGLTRTLSIGVTVVQDAVTMTLDGRAGVDVPLSLLDAYNPDLTGFEDATFPTDWIENGCDPSAGGNCQRQLAPNPRQGGGSSGQARPYASVGMVQRIFGPQLVFAVHALIPMGGFTGGDQFFVDEREQFFSNSLHSELLSDRLSAPSIAVAIGSEIYDGLSIGAGIGVRLRTDAFAETFVTDGNDQAGTLQLSTEIDVSVGVAPYLALAYVFGDDAGLLTFTAHSPNSFEVGVGLRTILADGDNQRAKRTATLDYMPWQLGLGGEVALPTVGSTRIAINGGAVYRMWSQYIDRQSNRPSGDYAWVDTISPSLGVRVTQNDLSYGGNLIYTPTPVPLQTGRTNYVDNGRIGIDGQISYEFSQFERPIRLGLNGQLQRLIPRYQEKDTPETTPGAEDRTLVIDEFPDDAVDTRRQQPVANAVGLQTNNPGWPGFGSEGWLWGAGLTFEFLY